MQLNLPRKITFWASIILAVVGAVAFVVHPYVNVPFLGAIGFFLVVSAFVVLCLGLILKDF